MYDFTYQTPPASVLEGTTILRLLGSLPINNLEFKSSAQSMLKGFLSLQVEGCSCPKEYDGPLQPSSLSEYNR